MLDLDRLREELRLAHARLADLDDDAPDLHFTLSPGPDPRVTHGNLAASRELGWKQDALLHRSLLDFIDPDDHGHLRYALESLRHGEEVPPRDLMFRRRDGRLLPLKARFVTEHEADGSLRAIRVLARNLVEQSRLELNLHERQFQALCDHAPVTIFKTSSAGECTYVNAHWTRMTGYTFEEMKGDAWVRAIHPEDQGEFYKNWRETARREEEFRRRYRCVTKGGETRWASVIAIPVRDAEGELSGYIGTVTDVTAEKQTVDSLEASWREQELLHTRLQLATESANIGVWEWDLVHDQLVWDDQMFRIYGMEGKDVAGPYDTWRHAVHPDDLERADQAVMKALETRTEMHTEFRILIGDEVRYLEAHGRVRCAPDGRPLKLVGVNWDITVRKQLEQEAMEATEKERNLLGRAIHDGAAQELAGTAWMCAALGYRLTEEGNPAGANAATIAERLSQSATDLRRLSHGLAPMAVEGRSLSEALQLISGLGQFYPKIAFEIDTGHCGADIVGPHATQLYLIAREAAFNAARHAKPTRIRIRLEEIEDGRAMVLTVTDNGGGSLKDLKSREGLGLRSMRLRAWSIDGHLQFDQNGNHDGIEVRCQVSQPKPLPVQK